MEDDQDNSFCSALCVVDIAARPYPNFRTHSGAAKVIDAMARIDLNSYKNFGHKFWWLEINIGQNLMIQYNLESGERDLSNGDTGIRVL